MKREYRIEHELPADFEIADYANNVHVARGSHEVILTFFQVVLPVSSNEGEADNIIPAKPVARVALPTAVAVELARLLGVGQDQGE